MRVAYEGLTLADCDECQAETDHEVLHVDQCNGMHRGCKGLLLLRCCDCRWEHWE